jgi:hypothetical protein
MTSVERSPVQIPANKLYINVAGIQSTIYDGLGTASSNIVPWVNQVGALSTQGAVVLRDMGKYVYLPGSASGGASQSTILRKVQLVPQAGQGYYGTGGDAATTTEYFTGYIVLGGQTYGGGNGNPTAVARLN